MSVETCLIQIGESTYEVPREVYIYVLELRQKIIETIDFLEEHFPDDDFGE